MMRLANALTLSIIVIISLLPNRILTSPVPGDTIEITNGQNAQPKVIQVPVIASSPGSKVISNHSETATIAPGNVKNLAVSSSTASPQVDPKATFNDRRRDMFFDNYTLKQVEIIDTKKVDVNQFIADKEKKEAEATLNQSPQTPQSGDLPLAQAGSGLGLGPEVQTNFVNGNSNGNKSIISREEESVDIAPLRQTILLPKVESGRPTCTANPDDTFCEDVPNYPSDVIRGEIGISPTEYHKLFGKKPLDGRRSYFNEHSNNNEEAVCRHVPKMVFPQMAKNEANQWIYVVNEVEYAQSVTVDICERPNKPCAYLESLPPGQFSLCKQKFSMKRLLALHPTEKRTYPETFKFPSCCACYIRSTDGKDLARTLGFGEESNVSPAIARSPPPESSNVPTATTVPATDSSSDPALASREAGKEPESPQISSNNSIQN